MFALSVATALCSFCAQGLAFVSLPFFFETVLHRDPVQTGFLMAPWAVVVAAAAPLAGRLSDSHAPGLMGGVGLAILSSGMVAIGGAEPVWVARISAAGQPLVESAGCSAVFGVGGGELERAFVAARRA